jgi:hypothetical protein
VWSAAVKQKRWIVIGLLVLIAVGVAAALEIRARMWEERWEGFVREWEAKGEQLDPTAWLPAAMADDQEFAQHPWIRKVAGGDHGLLEFLKTMDPEQLDGYDAWDEATDDDDNHSPMPPELARRVRQHAAGFQAELQSLAEAVRRPGSRIDLSADYNDNWVVQLNQPASVIAASCHAAATLGDAQMLTHGIETLLRLGNHLRRSNQTISVVYGCGIEGNAFNIINSLPDPAKFSPADRTAWIASLDLHTRTPEDEFAAASRVERGKFLRMLGQFEPPGPGLARFGAFRRVYLARARLGACEAFQGMVLADGGVPVTRIDPARIVRFHAYLQEKSPKRSAAEAFGLMAHTPMLGIYEAIVFHEEIRTATREKLRIPSP